MQQYPFTEGSFLSRKSRSQQKIVTNIIGALAGGELFGMIRAN
jgi:hypothetical protein